MTLQRLWRRLPLRFRMRVWRGLDRLGAWPVRLTAGPARGLSILAPISRWRYRAGRHERPVLDLLARSLEPEMEFVDVGAFLGYFTLAAAIRVGPEGRVWAFEPYAESRRRLERSVRRNGLANVTIVPLALGKSSGRGELTRPANPSTGRLVPRGSGPGETTAVEVTTLDAWVSASGARPDMVKIDVEGAELDVLTGAAETLRRHRPLLVIEVHRGPGLEALPFQLVELLRAAGYRVEPLAANGSGDLATCLERFVRGSSSSADIFRLHLLATPGRAG